MIDGVFFDFAVFRFGASTDALSTFSRRFKTYVTEGLIL